MANESEIAIIIPVFNEQDTIAKVLENIDYSLDEPATVYLIADFDSDPTISAAEAVIGLTIQIRFIIQNGAHGPASAIKLGIDSSTEKYLVFMTADDSDDASDEKSNQSDNEDNLDSETMRIIIPCHVFVHAFH